MDKALKQVWIEALRGRTPKKYKQGRGYLRTEDDEYCCLGVLCDLFDPTGWSDDSQLKFHEASEVGVYGYGNRIDIPSASTLADVGLPHALALSLALMNDEGRKFSTMADFIQRNVPVDEETPA